jgi:hypothetical protein
LRETTFPEAEEEVREMEGVVDVDVAETVRWLFLSLLGDGTIGVGVDVDFASGFGKDDVFAVEVIVPLAIPDKVVALDDTANDFDRAAVVVLAEASMVSRLRFLSCSLGASTTRLPTLNPGIANMLCLFGEFGERSQGWRLEESI